MTHRSILAATWLALAAFAAHAHDYKAGTLAIHHPYARATVPGQAVGAGYLTVVNEGRPDRLLGAEAGVSKKVELHSMTMDGDVMRMREVEAVELPTGRAVEFKPGSYHLMFVDLKAPLKVGDRFPMKLRFQGAGDVTVEVVVQAVGEAPSMPVPVPGHRMNY